jgi:hypothetical protein
MVLGPKLPQPASIANTVTVTMRERKPDFPVNFIASTSKNEFQSIQF